MTKSILLVGVGGQGTILASKLLTIGLMKKGYDVKMSEIHGMAQRGGAVSSQVRYGKEPVQSPVIEKGDADILVAFEKMEALRWLGYLKTTGRVIVNDLEINSTPILTGKADYPHDAVNEIEKKMPVTVINATKLAEKLGNSKVMNIILLGATVKAMGLTDIDWEGIVRENVPVKFTELNLEAIRQGMELVA
jgi:indolepyruvate ferredoxin oxidoreductase beta subunit